MINILAREVNTFVCKHLFYAAHCSHLIKELFRLYKLICHLPVTRKHYPLLLTIGFIGNVMGIFECNNVINGRNRKYPVCLPEDYKIFDLPIKDGPNNIEVTVDVDQLQSINKEDFSFTFTAFFNLGWKDTRIKKLESLPYLTPIDSGIIDEIWQPNVYISCPAVHIMSEHVLQYQHLQYL